MSPIRKLYIHSPVRFAGEGEDPAHLGARVAQLECLERSDHQNAQLQLGKPPTNAHPGPVTKGDVGEGMGLTFLS